MQKSVSQLSIQSFGNVELTPSQIYNIKNSLPSVLSFLGSQEYITDMENRQKRTDLYKLLLSKEEIDNLEEIEFGQIMSSLWASNRWGNKGYFVSKNRRRKFS
jgi:hypothetical protein